MFMRLQGHPQFCFPDSLLIFLIPIPIPSRPQCRTKKQWRSLVIQQIQELDEQIHRIAPGLQLAASPVFRII